MRVPRVPRAAGCLVAALVAAAGPARADGELTARGMYYKEESTRVVQPMLDGAFDVGDTGSARAHFLVDAITSASVSAGPGGDGFTEKRYEAGLGYRHQLRRLALGGTVKYSTEPDYKSRYGALTAELELLQKNVTVAATLGGGYDSIIPAGAQERHDLAYGLGSLSVSQLVNRHGVVGLSYDVIHLDGYQSNPYRRVTINGTLLQENHPATRTRHAVAASVKWFFPSVTTTVIGSYRFYADDWDLHAHTPELRVVKDVGDWIAVGARYRYHRQDAADFYQAQYDALQTFVSDDDKLSAFDGHLLGGRLEVAGGALGATGTLESARLELIGEYVVQHNRFGNALVSYVALVLPFEY